MTSDRGKLNFKKIRALGRMSGLILLTLLATWGSFGTLSIVQAQEPGECSIEEPDGIDFHEEGAEGDKVYVVCIDLTDPYIRFETVMADDVLDVNPRPNPFVRERVEDMVRREPYSFHNPVVAFNADYFGDRSDNVHGPEGPTVKNGYRIDGPNSTDDLINDKSTRVALSISRLNKINLEKKGNAELANISIHLTKLYNTVGGGPTLVRGGQVIPDPCNPIYGENVGQCSCTYSMLVENERVCNCACIGRLPGCECSEPSQTAIGISQNGQVGIVVVAESKSAEQMGEILRRYGAYSAIKLDGGSSSQLWYRGEPIKAGGREIADAILVFREDIPRHGAWVSYQSEYPIVEPGETVTLTFELWNLGFLTWEADLPYALLHTGGENFGLAREQRLLESIPTGHTIAWYLTFEAPQEPGTYQTRWKMAYSTIEGINHFGTEVGYVVTVLPERRPPNLTDAVRQTIDQFRQEVEQTAEEYLDELQRRIDERIREEEERVERGIERFIRNLIPDCLENCLLGPAAIIFTFMVFGWRKKAKIK